MKELAVVICNFNKKDYLRECLKSVYESEIDSEYDVIVVDNASTDGAPEMVKEEFKQTILLENEENLGGSGGFARGMEYAKENKYQYIALLDNDIKVEHQTLQKLKRYIKNNPKYGVVGAKILTMDNPDIIQDYGSFIDWNDYTLKIPYKGCRDRDDLVKKVDCDYVPACCAITTGRVLKQVGVFDIKHFIYWDDMDWCLRVKESGYEVCAIDEARVYHKMGAINKENTFSLYYFERNRILFFLKHLPKEQKEVFLNKILLDFMRSTFFSNVKGIYSSAKTFFYIFEDIANNRLGRQEARVVNIEKKEPLQRFQNIQNDKIFLMIDSDDMYLARKVYVELSRYFRDSVMIVAKAQLHQKLQQEFNTEINSVDDVGKSDFLFLACQHVMDSKVSVERDCCTYLVDKYINIVALSELQQVHFAYQNYHSIFENIYKPVLIESILT